MRKFQSKLRSKRGFSLVELAIAMGIVVILIVTITMGSGLKQTARTQSTAETVKTIQSAAEGYIAQGNTTYTGVDIATLQSLDLLPAGFSGNNNFGGAITIAANGTDATQFDISLSSIPSDVGTRLSNLFANSSSATAYDAGTSTWTVTF